MNPQLFSSITAKIASCPDSTIPGPLGSAEPHIIDGITAIKEQQKHWHKLNTYLNSTSDLEEVRRVQLRTQAQTRTTRRRFYRKWSKLTADTQIQLILNYIEKLKHQYHISLEQESQLTYLLISAVNQKEINDDQDVDYDCYKTAITAINRLICTPEGQFCLLSSPDAEKSAQSLSNLSKIDRRITVSLRSKN